MSPEAFFDYRSFGTLSVGNGTEGMRTERILTAFSQSPFGPGSEMAAQSSTVFANMESTEDSHLRTSSLADQAAGPAVLPVEDGKCRVNPEHAFGSLAERAFATKAWE